MTSTSTASIGNPKHELKDESEQKAHNPTYIVRTQVCLNQCSSMLDRNNFLYVLCTKISVWSWPYCLQGHA